MDWLLARQDRIQKKLAARHLKAGGLVLYDLSSSYFEGTTGHAAGNACPLVQRGYSRDGKRGTLQVELWAHDRRRGAMHVGRREQVRWQPRQRKRGIKTGFSVDRGARSALR